MRAIGVTAIFTASALWPPPNLVPVRFDHAMGIGVIGGDTVVLKGNRYWLVGCSDFRFGQFEAYRFGTNANYRLHRVISEFEGKAENICSH